MSNDELALIAAREIQQAYEDEIEGDSENIAFLMTAILRAIDHCEASQRLEAVRETIRMAAESPDLLCDTSILARVSRAAEGPR